MPPDVSRPQNMSETLPRPQACNVFSKIMHSARYPFLCSRRPLTKTRWFDPWHATHASPGRYHLSVLLLSFLPRGARVISPVVIKLPYGLCHPRIAGRILSPGQHKAGTDIEVIGVLEGI